MLPVKIHQDLAKSYTESMTITIWEHACLENNVLVTHLQ